MTVPNLFYEACAGVDLASDTTTSSGKRFTTSGTTNTKSAWTQLSAATAADIDFLMIAAEAYTINNIANSFSFDLGIGASGSEVIIAADIMVGWASAMSGFRMPVPLHIPAGSRVSLRFQSSNTTDVVAINLQGYTCNTRGYNSIESMGFRSANTSGTFVSPSATANTKGSWVQLTASTPKEYKGIFFILDNQGYLPAKPYLIDIAIGASGSEIVLLPNIAARLDNGNPMYASPFVPLNIPPASRISARCQAPGASANGPCITAYGVA